MLSRRRLAVGTDRGRPLAPEEPLEVAAHVGVVVGDQDRGRARVGRDAGRRRVGVRGTAGATRTPRRRTACRSRAAGPGHDASVPLPRGSRRVNVDPTPTSLVDGERALRAAWSARPTSARPMPLPSRDAGPARLDPWNRSNSRAAAPPARCRRRCRRRRAPRAAVLRRRSRTVMPPSNVNFSALESRLRTIFSHISAVDERPGARGAVADLAGRARRVSKADRNTPATRAVHARAGRRLEARRRIARPRSARSPAAC